MAPANVVKQKPILKGVVAYCHVLNEDGSDVSSATEKEVKDLGGSTTRRLAASTHVFLSSNVVSASAVYNEALSQKKKMVTTQWIEVCKALGERISTTSFAPAAPVSPAIFLAKKNGTSSRRQRNKFETVNKEDATLPSPSAAWYVLTIVSIPCSNSFAAHPCILCTNRHSSSSSVSPFRPLSFPNSFSSSQMKDPVAQQEASRRIRGGRRSSAAAKKLKLALPSPVEEADEEEEKEGEEEKEEHEEQEEGEEEEEGWRVWEDDGEDEVETLTPKQSMSESNKTRRSFLGRTPASARRGKKLAAAVAAEAAHNFEDGQEDDDKEDELEPDSARQEEGEAERARMVQGEEDSDSGNSAASAPAATAAFPAKRSSRGGKKTVEFEKKGEKEAGRKNKKRALELGLVSAVCTGEWDCSRCTFNNRARAKQCEMCNFSRGGMFLELKDDQSGAEKEPAPSFPTSSSPSNKKPRTGTNARASISSASRTSDAGSRKKRIPVEKENTKRLNSKAFHSAAFSSSSTFPSISNSNNDHRKKEAVMPSITSKEKKENGEMRTKAQVEDGVVILAVSGMDGDVRSALAAEMKELGKKLATEGGGTAPLVKMVQTDDPSVVFTHLLVPADRECRRTLKVLFALCSGAHIVTADWLVESAAKNRWLPEENYTIQRFQRRPTEQERHVAAGEKVYFGPCETPSRRILGKLVVAAGGRPTTSLRDATLVVVQSGLAATEEWLVATLQKKATGARLQELLDERLVVEPLFLFEGIDAGVLPEDKVRANPLPLILRPGPKKTTDQLSCSYLPFPGRICHHCSEHEEEGRRGWRQRIKEANGMGEISRGDLKWFLVSSGGRGEALILL